MTEAAVSFAGNLTADLELRHTDTGRDVSEACSRSALSFPIKRVTPRLDPM